MPHASYLIAKYVPDLFRNEPVNVGIVLWCNGLTASRFVGERPSDRVIDGRHLTGEIKQSLAVYKQWVESWRGLLKKDQIRPVGRSEFVQKTNEGYLDALQLSGRDNFILEKGGELLEEIDSEALDDVAEYLFHRLVASPDKETDGKSAEAVRDELLQEARVATDPRVKRNQKVPVLVGGREFRPEFHLYIGNGSPDLLAQVLPLTSQPREIKKTAESIAHRFSHVIEGGKIQPEKCLAIIYSPDDRQDELISESFDELQGVSTIIDLRSERLDLVSRIKTWVESSSSHDVGPSK